MKYFDFNIFTFLKIEMIYQFQHKDKYIFQ